MDYKKVVILMLLVVPSLSLACVGKVNRVQLTRAGQVEIISSELFGSGSAGKAVCNVSKTWNGVAPESCRGWYALIIASLAQDKKVRLQYENTEPSCRELPNWGDAPAPWMISNAQQ